MSIQNRAREQEIADFVTTVVEDQGPPVGVEALAGIFVLEAGRPVKRSQRVTVGGEMGGDPIDDDADPGLVADLAEFHEVVRSSEATGRSEIARCLVAPRSVERVFVDRHQLNVRVAQVLHVLDQQVRQLAIIVKLSSITGPFPGPEMHFVNGNWLFIPARTFTLGHPFTVAPIVSVQVVDDRGAFRWQFCRERIWIRLLQQVSLIAADAEFVRIALLHSRNKSPPDSVAARIQPMLTMHPHVEIAEDGNFGRVRCPDGKTNARNSILRVEVSTEMLVNSGIHP